MLNLRLTQDSTFQALVARFNYLLHNRVRNSFSSWLNPRANARAAVVLSSTNVQFVRNWMVRVSLFDILYLRVRRTNLCF